MQILKNIMAEDLFLYLKEHKTLVFADVHIGYEEYLHSQGFLIIKQNFKDLIKRLEKIINNKQFDIEQIVINGDVKHEFGHISDEEWKNTLKLIDYLSKYLSTNGKKGKLTLIKGNHDKILGPIANKRNLEVVDELILGDILITHGDKISKTITAKKLAKNIKTIIIGHEHPAVSLTSGVRTEKFKCFLVGKYGLNKLKKLNLIVLPSLNLITEGTDILKERLLSPYLKNTKNIFDFNVFIVEDKLYDFGNVKKLMKL